MPSADFCLITFAIASQGAAVFRHFFSLLTMAASELGLLVYPRPGG